jgi:hypothetical protein
MAGNAVLGGFFIEQLNSQQNQHICRLKPADLHAIGN